MVPLRQAVPAGLAMITLIWTPSWKVCPDGHYYSETDFWGNNGTTDQTLTELAQWAMPDYDQVRPDYDYSDASGAPQFYHLIDIPPGHTGFSLTIPASTSLFAISGVQIVAGP